MRRPTLLRTFPACCALILAGCAPARAPLPAPGPIFAQVAGRWGWPTGEFTCETNPHTITFSPDWKQMIFRYPAPVDSTGRREARYEVRGHTERSIRGFMLGEERRDDDGKLVEWDLVLLSAERYAWRRADWGPRDYTRALRRCMASDERIAAAGIRG